MDWRSGCVIEYAEWARFGMDGNVKLGPIVKVPNNSLPANGSQASHLSIRQDIEYLACSWPGGESLAIIHLLNGRGLLNEIISGAATQRSLI